MMNVSSVPPLVGSRKAVAAGGTLELPFGTTTDGSSGPA